MALPDTAEGFDQVQVPGQAWLLEVRTAGFTPVVVGQGGDAFAGHRAGKQTRLQCGIGYDAGAGLLAERQDIGFSIAHKRRVGWLQRGDLLKKTVVIIGGGAAGHQIAYQLRDVARVILVDPKTYWEVPMALPRLLANPKSLPARIRYAEFLDTSQHIQGRVAALSDTSAKVTH